jgi:hypothetical protein
MNLYATWRFSPKIAAELGWTCVHRNSVIAKATRWQHRDGWTLAHCGHPTALYPWVLRDPQGGMVLAPNGRAWASLPDAMQHVYDQGEP